MSQQLRFRFVARVSGLNECANWSQKKIRAGAGRRRLRICRRAANRCDRKLLFPGTGLSEVV
jgi:hypothetical protein